MLDITCPPDSQWVIRFGSAALSESVIAETAKCLERERKVRGLIEASYVERREPEPESPRDLVEFLGSIVQRCAAISDALTLSPDVQQGALPTEMKKQIQNMLALINQEIRQRLNLQTANTGGGGGGGKGGRGDPTRHQDPNGPHGTGRMF